MSLIFILFQQISLYHMYILSHLPRYVDTAFKLKEGISKKEINDGWGWSVKKG